MVNTYILIGICALIVSFIYLYYEGYITKEGFDTKNNNKHNSNNNEIDSKENKIDNLENVKDNELSPNINSLHNLIENGDFYDETNIDNLGNISVSRQVIKTDEILETLPFKGNALRYNMNGGIIVNLTLPELYVNDMVFSFYIKKDVNTPDFNVTVKIQSDLTDQIINPVTNNWQRIEIYHSHDTSKSFKVEVSIENNGNKSFYATGFQLENNLVALPFFSGRVFHTWDDVEPPEIAYVYNVNHLSTIPPQHDKLDITTLMSYNTLNQQRNSNNIGFEKEQGIHFDGNKVYMIIPTTLLKPIILKQFSVSLWIRFREFSSSSNYQSIFGVKNNNENTYLYLEETEGKIRIRIKNNTTFSHIFNTIRLDIDKWYFMALTIFDNKVRLYAYHYYEEVDIDSAFLSTNVDTKIMVGVPPDYNKLLYKNHMLYGDVGGISIWRRQLLPENIKKLSKTFKDIKLALPKITQQQLVSTGLTLPQLNMNIITIDGLGMCTYNAHIKWNIPQLPLDYIKLGYNIVKYEAKLEYYVGNNLISKEQLESYITTNQVTKNMKDIKITYPPIHCKECILYVINVPYEYNYRLYVRYIVSNNETSNWSEMDLRFRDELVKKFNITLNSICKNKNYQIDSKTKILDEQKQNKFIAYSQRKVDDLK